MVPHVNISSFTRALTNIPNVGLDSDFERIEDNTIEFDNIFESITTDQKEAEQLQSDSDMDIAEWDLNGSNST